MYDVIIIGAGPAGISAGLYTQRGNLKTLILYHDSGNISKAKKIENYYGFENGIKGNELFKQGIKQAINLGIDIKKDEVLKIEFEGKSFKVITSEEQYICKTVILALGVHKNVVKIQGIEELEGKGISYCAICDGFFYRNKEVSVLGSGKYAISETNDLINIAKKVTILTNGQKAPEFRADNVDILTKPIKEISGNQKVEKVIFQDDTELKTEGIFIAHGVAGANDFAKKLGILTSKEKIIVNEKMETNMPGIYACGDCTGGILQISKAGYEGTVAGLEAIKYIKKNIL